MDRLVEKRLTPNHWETIEAADDLRRYLTENWHGERALPVATFALGRIPWRGQEHSSLKRLVPLDPWCLMSMCSRNDYCVPHLKCSRNGHAAWGAWE